MSIQDEMNAGAQEYAKRLERAREDERLAALKLEAQHYGNASLFAAAIENAFTQHDTDTDTQEN